MLCPASGQSNPALGAGGEGAYRRAGLMPTEWRKCVILAVLTVLAIIAVALVALPWALLALATRQSALYPFFQAERLLVSEAYEGLRTGDLLLFTGATHNVLAVAATQEFFTHGAFVVREGELAYTSEASQGSHLYAAPAGHPGPRHFALPAGAALAPLLPRVKYYNGLCFLLRLEGAGLDPSRERAVKAEADRLAAASYAYPGPAQAALALLGRPTKSRHCFQHVAHLLGVSGLTADLGNPGFLQSCHEICALPGKMLPGGRRYSPPLLLVYDIA